jgi:hypothetical protein
LHGSSGDALNCQRQGLNPPKVVRAATNEYL